MLDISGDVGAPWGILCSYTHKMLNSILMGSEKMSGLKTFSFTIGYVILSKKCLISSFSMFSAPTCTLALFTIPSPLI